MANPYLPLNEYIPDGEPRVFGERVYIYGSHDKAGSDSFCDYVLKCWSAPIDNLNEWVCHGDIFRTMKTRDYEADTSWTNANTQLYAPDVVEKDGKYYLFAYIVNAKGCVAVSDKPEGPFKLLAPYEYTIPDSICCNGWFIDPGVLVDDDGRVFIYCGFERSFMAEIDGAKMNHVLDGTCIEHFIPVTPREEDGFVEEDSFFFEAASPRKVGDTYYMIYSPKKGSRLAYATSKSPTGPFKYRGYIVDNSRDYPGGNDHGSIACINGEWYIFYHRMTNGTITSRRACVEKITIKPDGSIPMVEMTSLGFEKSLNPYKQTPADIACVLTGGAYITEKSVFTRVIRNITKNCIIGYRYFDFGDDFGSKTMELAVKFFGMGCDARLDVYIDGVQEENVLVSNVQKGKKIGSVKIDKNDGVANAVVDAVTGVHSLFFVVQTDYTTGWMKECFETRCLFELESFVFIK